MIKLLVVLEQDTELLEQIPFAIQRAQVCDISHVQVYVNSTFNVYFLNNSGNNKKGHTFLVMSNHQKYEKSQLNLMVCHIG